MYYENYLSTEAMEMEEENTGAEPYDEYMQEKENDDFDQYMQSNVKKSNMVYNDEVLFHEQEYRSENNILDRVGYGNFGVKATNRAYIITFKMTHFSFNIINK